MLLNKIVKATTTLVVLILLLLIGRNIILKIYYPEAYKEYIEKYSEEYGVDKELIFAIIKSESNFKEETVSSKNAIGLMQLLESTAFEVADNIKLKITKEEIIEPKININLGTKYISILIQKYDNIRLAVAAYNAGIGNVDSWIKEGIIKSDGSDIENIPYKETNNYVRKVLRNYKIYQELYK